MLFLGPLAGIVGSRSRFPVGAGKPTGRQPPQGQTNHEGYRDKLPGTSELDGADRRDRKHVLHSQSGCRTPLARVPQFWLAAMLGRIDGIIESRDKSSVTTLQAKPCEPPMLGRLGGEGEVLTN